MKPRSVFAIVAAVAVLAGAGGAMLLRGGEGTYQVTAYFPRAIGLFPRSTVRVLGVEVGRITAVSPEGDRVRVAMRIREDIKVPANATAIIVPISLISDRYVQLAPVWRSGPALRDGAEIPLERGVAPAELDDLLATLKRFLEAIEPGTATSPGALGRFVQNAERALDGQGQALATTIDALATILDALGSNASSVDQLIVNLDRLVGELSQHDGALRDTNRGLAAVFGTLGNEQSALVSGTGNLAALVAELGRLVRDHRADLEADLLTLAQTTDVLHRQKMRLLEQILWLPVLSKGARGAYDEQNKRVLVRDATPGVKP
jgi:phospholipid/cholesterol/gamma-HCH transport system substrate-binding protein